MTDHSRSRSSGLPYALGAHFIWGISPAYLRLMRSVSPLELIAWRVVFTLPFCWAILYFRRDIASFMATLRSARTLRMLSLATLFIAGHWIILYWAILSGHVFATSLGYYINPLMNVLAGTIFLGERLTGRQWAAAGLALAGVGLFAAEALASVWIALALAATFCAYGLVRRHSPLEAAPGLMAETLILTVPAAGFLFFTASRPVGLSFGKSVGTDTLIVFSGVVSSTPMLLFTIAARRMDYSLLGFIQYLAPTLMFLEGLFLFDEPLNPVQLVSFAIIWCSVALFVWDIFSGARRKRMAAASA